MTQRSYVWVCSILLAAGLSAAPALAQAGACEAKGKVVDEEGEPVAGVTVKFIPESNVSLVYSSKTNKKGRYSIPSMFSSQGDEWKVELEAEGLSAVQMEIESRRADRSLVGDIRTEKIAYGSRIPGIRIRPLGEARVDFVVAPEAELAKRAATATGVASEAPVASAAGSPAPASRDAYDEAVRLANEGDLEGAVPRFEKALRDKPDDAQRHEALAKVLYRLERYDEAETATRKAIELDPETVGPRMVLYSIQVGRDDLEGAKATLDEARQVAPKDLRVLKQLVHVAHETGRTEEEIAAYEAMLEIDPENAEAWMSLGFLHARAGNRERSEEAYGKAIEFNPGQAHQSYFNVGAQIMNNPNRSGADTERAIGAFRKAIELNPGYAPAHKQLAYALLGTGNRDGARAALEAYLEHAPQASDAGQVRSIISTLER